MLKIIFLTLFCFAFPLFSQAIYQKTDDFTNQTHYFTQDREAKLVGGSFWSGRYVRFHLFAVNLTRPYYSIVVSTHTDGWVFIKKGPSLLLKVNGKNIVSLIGDGSVGSREVITSSLVAESASYEITLSQFQEFSKAEKVEFRLVGGEQTITGEFSPEFLADMLFFTKKAPGLIKDTSTATTPEEGNLPKDAQYQPVDTKNIFPIQASFGAPNMIMRLKVSFGEQPLALNDFIHERFFSIWYLRFKPTGKFAKAILRVYFLDESRTILNPDGFEFMIEAKDCEQIIRVTVPKENQPSGTKTLTMRLISLV